MSMGTTAIWTHVIDVDASDWPFVAVRFSGEPVPLPEWNELFTQVRGFLARQEPFVMLIDARKGLGAGAKHSRAATEFIRDSQHDLRTFCRGVVTVSDSALVRSIITAIQWFVPPPFPDRVEGDIDAAWRWLERQLGVERGHA